jgi:hypothetical protein
MSSAIFIIRFNWDFSLSRVSTYKFQVRRQRFFRNTVAIIVFLSLLIESFLSALDNHGYELGTFWHLPELAFSL